MIVPAGPPSWTVESSRSLHEDRWLRVRADRCVTGSGAVLDPYYVLQYTDWVNVVALTGDGQVVLVRQYRHGLGEAVLELPGGMIDAKEDAVTAAARELAEETGYRADGVRLLHSAPANPATHTNRIHTCLAAHVRPGPAAREAGEDLEVCLMPVATLLDELRASRFGQSMQVGALLLALEAAGLLRLTTPP